MDKIKKQYIALDNTLEEKFFGTPLQKQIMNTVTNGIGYNSNSHHFKRHSDDSGGLQMHLVSLDIVTEKIKEPDYGS